MKNNPDDVSVGKQEEILRRKNNTLYKLKKSFDYFQIHIFLAENSTKFVDISGLAITKLVTDVVKTLAGRMSGGLKLGRIGTCFRT